MNGKGIRVTTDAARRGGSPGTSLERLLLQTVARSPDPPRRITYRQTLTAVCASAVGFAGFIFGTTLAIAGIGAAITPGGIVPLALALLFGGTAVFLLQLPFTYAHRVQNALITGILGEALITSVVAAERPGRRSLDAMSNGFVEGVRRVHHPFGDFDDTFKYDGLGASRLRVGTPMRVLLDPRRQRVLLTVPTSLRQEVH